MKAKSKKNAWKFPSFMSLLLTFMLGLFLRKGCFEVVPMIWVSGFLTLMVLPFEIVKFQDSEQMRATQELIKSLQGE